MKHDLKKDFGLSDKETAFVLEFIKDRNGSRAASEAGYKNPRQMANKLKNKPQIQKALQSFADEVEEKALVTQEQVINGLLSEAKFVGEGSSHAARVSAWEKLGKHLNMFTENVKVKGEGTGVVFNIDLKSNDTAD